MKSVIIFVSFFLLSGCATIDVWKNDTYEEHISHFLTTQDGNTLIVIGDRYHYLFPEAKQLNEIMQSKNSGFLRAEFGNKFVVSKDNDIRGTFRILCDCKKPSKDLVNWLLNSGFKKVPVENKCSSNIVSYVRERTISGKRYSASNESFDTTKKLNGTYVVYIEEEHGPLGTVARIAKTPISVAVDGFYAFGTIAIAVGLWPITTYNIVSSYINEETIANDCKKHP